MVYVAGITVPGQRTASDRATMMAVFGREPVSPGEITQISRQFGPPQGRTTVMRPVHPDLVVGLFSLMALVFLFNTFSASAVSFWTILIIWLVFLGGYVLARKRIVSRHLASLDTVRLEKDGVQNAVERWMGLYYCASDGCVFDPRRGDSVPLEGLQGYLRLPPA